LTGEAQLDSELKDNGGPTRTLALLPNSIAIDSGANPGSLAYDQRGAPFPRVVGGAPDIGAFEFHPACDGVEATIIGSRGADVLKGTSGRDVIQGLGGGDRLSGAGGRDLICGAAGPDTLKGGKGRDVLIGGSGNDVLHGGKSVDVVFGGSPHAPSARPDVRDRCPGGLRDHRHGCPTG
jgi:Ca2+-binding RTX toxin-like protein